MTQRVYKAATLAEALAQAKRELGPDALILRTRSVRSGGVLGMGAREVYEVVAGLEAEGAGIRQDDVPSSATLARAARAYQSLGALNETTAGDTPPTRSFLPPQSGESPEPSPLQPSSIEAELASLKRLVGQVLHTTREASLRVGRVSSSLEAEGGISPLDGVRGSRDALVAHYLRLLEADVAAEIADEVVADVRERLSPAELHDTAKVREAVLHRLSAMVPAGQITGAGAIVRGPGGRPHVIALIGPTGVGKTTTLAKLAASYSLRHERSVGIIACDTVRLGAVDQLRLYATIIGVPMRVCATPRDVRAAIESLAGCDVVLMDTAGSPPRDPKALAEVRALLDAAKPDETHLVLSATSSQATLVEAGRLFAPANPDRLILTKVDEAVNLGVLIGAAKAIDLRLSYLATGQDVPDDLEVGGGERVARLVLGEDAAMSQATSSR